MALEVRIRRLNQSTQIVVIVSVDAAGGLCIRRHLVAPVAGLGLARVERAAVLVVDFGQPGQAVEVFLVHVAVGVSRCQGVVLVVVAVCRLTHLSSPPWAVLTVVLIGLLSLGSARLRFKTRHSSISLVSITCSAPNSR